MRIDPRKYERILAEKCLTTKGLCERAGLNAPTVNRTVRGLNNRPATIGRIAKGLGVSIDDLIAEEGGD